MLTKSDLAKLKRLFKGFATKTDLKTFATKTDLTPVKTDLQAIKQDFAPIKTDLQTIKQDLDDVKKSTKFTEKAVIDILGWTQDIHEIIVLQKMPERVKKPEQIVKTS